MPKIPVTDSQFASLTHRSQVLRLRKLGVSALGQYDLPVANLKFINHGENTTFRVNCHSRDTFLLRIHRQDYHTDAALMEELSWLKDLANQGFSLPYPMESRQNSLFVKSNHATVPYERNCSVLHWVHGKFVKEITEPILSQVAATIGKMHEATGNRPVMHRRYWDSEGLVGQHPKFGSVAAISLCTQEQEKLLREYQSRLYLELKGYEDTYPQFMGLIHADMHFGNLVLSQGQPVPIDFDDCGYGFQINDLVIPYVSALRMAPKDVDAKVKQQKYREALFNGYAAFRTLSQQDTRIFDVLVAARSLVMLGWLNSRSDNPSLRPHLAGALSSVLTQAEAWV